MASSCDSNINYMTGKLQVLSLVDTDSIQGSNYSLSTSSSQTLDAQVPCYLDISHEISRAAFQVWDINSNDFLRDQANQCPFASPISELQRYTLERIFNSNPHYDNNFFRHLSEVTGLSQEFLYSWFKVKRSIVAMGM